MRKRSEVSLNATQREVKAMMDEMDQEMGARQIQEVLVNRTRRGSLQKDLEELESTDPAVAAAAEKYEKTKREILSRPLKKELDRDPGCTFPVKLPVNAPGLHPGMQRIIEKVFPDHYDPEREYADLERDLRVGENWEQSGALMRALDKAETNSRRANRLWRWGVVERMRWELINEVKFSAMRFEATRALQQEKNEGRRSKQITDADVNSMCAQMFPDEYPVQEIQRARAKGTEESLSHLNDAWNSRCRSLQTMVGRSR